MTATDGFSAYIAAPAVARLRRDHPGLSVEIVTVTRRALQQRSGLDIEVVVGEPQVHRAEAVRLGEYMLGMYASRGYLAENGTPDSVEALTARIRWCTSWIPCCRWTTLTPRGGWCRPCGTA